MTKEFLMDGISYLDEDLIARFISIDEVLPDSRLRARKRRMPKMKIIASAACIALAIGLGFSSVRIMRMLGIGGNGNVTTDTVTDERPEADIITAATEDEKIDLNSDGVVDRIEVELAASEPTEATISVIDGKTGIRIWTGRMPVSKNERYAYYFSNSFYGEDRLICWSYSLCADGRSLLYKCEMFNFDESGQKKVLANTEHVFDFSDGHAPYESEEEYLSKLFANLNEYINSKEIKGYTIADNTGDELSVLGEKGIMRKHNISYTLSELIGRVSG